MKDIKDKIVITIVVIFVVFLILVITKNHNPYLVFTGVFIGVEILALCMFNYLQYGVFWIWGKKSYIRDYEIKESKHRLDINLLHKKLEESLLKEKNVVKRKR